MSVIDTARQYIGKLKYVFGSTDIESGTGDCSSFVQYVYAQNGIDIGRTTDIQYTGNGGEVTSIDDLQAGDLVFFAGTYDSGNTDGVSHVGIYSGNGNMIHLGNSGCEEVNIKNNSYYSSHFLAGKQIDGAQTVATGEVSEIDLNTWGLIVKYVVLVLILVLLVVCFVFSFDLQDNIAKAII